MLFVGAVASAPPPSPAPHQPLSVPRTRAPVTDVYEPISTISSSATAKRGAAPSSFLNLRRRTAEIRLGNDGKISTSSNG